MNRYEGMFLFDNSAARDWPAMEQEVRRLVERVDAELQTCVKYDERKLAFEIGRRKRGTYVLTYFDCAPERIPELERDSRLSELVLRLLVLRQEVSEARLAELKAWPVDTSLQPASDSRRHDDGRSRRDWGGPRRDRSGPRGPESKPPEPAADAPKPADIVSATITDAAKPPPAEPPREEPGPSAE